MKDYEIFIIWSNARKYEKKIIEIINKKLKIRNIVNVTWDQGKFTENLTTFYEADFRLDCHQVNVRGNGEFVLIFVEDDNPKFCSVKTSKGIEEANITVYEIKNIVRNLYTKDFSFHGSINRNECESNLIKIFGKNIDEFLEIGEGVNYNYKGNCLGVDGWNDANEIFKVLNASVSYAVLRMFDGIPEHYSYSVQGDIDILVDDLPRVACILQPWIDRTNNYRFFNWLNVNGERILIHPKYVGDYYYDSRWQQDILEKRVWNGHIYIPDDENLFWSLVYHGCFHKDNMLKYNDLLHTLARKIKTEYKPDVVFMSKSLADWMRSKGYKCKLHLDSGACKLNLNNIPEDLLDEKKEFYFYRSYCNNQNNASLIVDKELIRSNAQLFSDLIRTYDFMYRVEKHIVPTYSSLYKELIEKSKRGEMMWRYALRYGQISELTYTQTDDGVKQYNRTWITDGDISREEIIYSSENNIEHIDGILVDAIIKKQYVLYGINGVWDEVKNYIRKVFETFHIDDIYLNGLSWDMLSKNCIKRNSEYYFFDLEAKDKSNRIKKSDYIAWEIDWLMNIGIQMKNPEEVYRRLCKEFSVTGGDYEDAIYERKQTVLAIASPVNESNYYLYKKYIDAPFIIDDVPINYFDCSKLIEDYRNSIVIDNALFIEGIINRIYFEKKRIRKVAIYGLGKYGKRTISELHKCGIDVVGYMDRKVEEFDGHKVINRIQVIPDADLYIIAMLNYKEVMRQFKAEGIKNVISIGELISRIEGCCNE